MTAADLQTIALRLSVALLIGAAIGVQRHLHGQAAGLRTHALVALASAMAMLIVAPLPGSGSMLAPDAQSRVVQGILTGIGFLGAGLILHSDRGKSIHGLTSAAAIWITAVFGGLCGHGRVDVALVGFALVVIVLVVGAPIEETLRRRFPHSKSKHANPPEKNGDE